MNRKDVVSIYSNNHEIMKIRWQKCNFILKTGWISYVKRVLELIDKVLINLT